MSLIKVDQEKCKKDGICSFVCVAKIISKADADHYPEIKPEFVDGCITCGHCVAACPAGALDHEHAPLADCLPIPSDFQPEPGTVETVLQSRRSIRNYLDKPVPRELIKRLLDAGRYAPTGANLQNVRYIACDDPAKAHEFAGMVINMMRQKSPLESEGLIAAWDAGQDPILRGAPAFIVGYGEPGFATNSVLAMSYIDLMAYALGLGACFGGYFTSAINIDPNFKKELGIPQNLDAAATLMVGYPKFKYQRVPPRNEAKVKWA
ncbi:MAG: nitroreductase family protein [Deltaproteobacteria bacterium]|nr:nitroreductase family protein [Deltaproteobacteria bacterium]MBW2052329.1 nitroreductase family protein [Deltaproteobacteria bacterium]MBW2140218.1 nitroreductase family protein [Deltaproteobacteria bacterium]MBW2323468.1 nitroreductase family protein [Deltaproteobacteria bacterium]